MNDDVLDALRRTLLLCRDFVEPDEASDQQIVAAFTATSVCIIADEANMSCAASQSAIVAVVGQVAALGCHVRLCMPEVGIIGPQPPLYGERLRAGLVDYVGDLIPGCRAEIADKPATDDIMLAIGGSSVSDEVVEGWRLSGARWVGRIGPLSDRIAAWSTDFPMGALASATLAATEVFKTIMRRLRDRVGARFLRDELDRVDAVEVVLAEECVATRPLEFGAIDFVSGGAITNGFLHALLRIPGVSADIRVIEPEKLDRTNLNRYALARRCFERLLKTSMLERWSTPSIRIRGVPVRLDASTAEAVRPLAPRVVVGVDDIRSRWLVQSLDPEWLVVGATAHFLIIISEHMADMPCAGCMHPRDDGAVGEIATVSFVSYWAGLLSAARLLRRAAGDVIGSDQQSLTLRPLRLDTKHSRLMTAVPVASKCPVGCTAASSRRAS